jgi:hypothetical protein
MELAPVYGLVLHVSGDIVVTSQIHHVSHAHSSRQWTVLQSERAYLLEKFPGAECATFLIEKPEWSESPAEVSLLLCKTGRLDVTAPILPTRRIETAQPVDAREFASTGACLTTDVTIRDAADSPVHGSVFSLHTPSGDVIPLIEGQMQLPDAEYELACSDVRLHGRYQPTQVRLPGSINIRVDASLVACRLDVQDREGYRYSKYALSVTSAGRHTFSYVMDDAVAPSLLLPAGLASITVRAAGFEPTTVEANILRGLESQSIRVVLGPP